MVDGSIYNPMGGNLPSDYISDIANIELLISLSISPESPEWNRFAAMWRLQKLLSLHELRSHLIEFKRHVGNEEARNYSNLQEIIASKCSQIHAYSVSTKDLSKGEAENLLIQIANAAASGSTHHQVYEKLAQGFRYRPNAEKFPNHYATKIRNGGSFCVNQAKTACFPETGKWSKDLVQNLLKLDLNGHLLYHEEMTEEDRSIIAEFGDDFETRTEDRVILFVVIDLIEAIEVEQEPGY